MHTPTRATRTRPPRSPTVAWLTCPKCGSPRLSLLEQVIAIAGCHTIEERANGSLQFNLTGWSDVDWSNITAVGVRCDDCAHRDCDGPLEQIADRFPRHALNGARR